jgi:hypothetical protein
VISRTWGGRLSTAARRLNPRKVSEREARLRTKHIGRAARRCKDYFAAPEERSSARREIASPTRGSRNASSEAGKMF